MGRVYLIVKSAEIIQSNLIITWCIIFICKLCILKYLHSNFTLHIINYNFIIVLHASTTDPFDSTTLYKNWILFIWLILLCSPIQSPNEKVLCISVSIMGLDPK